MLRHEEGCTLNPNRFCRVCNAIEAEQKSIAHLISVMPDPKEYIHRANDNCSWFTDELTVASNAVLPDLRDMTENCPACIMAAIRQAGIPVPMVTDFDWTKEMASIWSEINSAQRDEDERYYCNE